MLAIFALNTVFLAPGTGKVNLLITMSWFFWKNYSFILSAMKKYLLLIVLLTLFSTLFAQVQAPDYYVVQLKNKGVKAESSFNPLSFLSEKAVERRIKQNISFGDDDIPVSEAYVKEIHNTGVKILTRSRWFNIVTIEATSDKISQISSLPFVSNIKRLSSRTDKKSVEKIDKFNTKNQVLPIPVLKAQMQGDLYNYGAALNQISQLNGTYLHNNGFSGQGMTIAVLDAGFNSVNTMACFDSLRKNNQIKGTRDFAQPGNNVYGTSMHSHGTQVLSCMGANISGQMVGTAPKANYWLLRTEVGEFERIIEEYFWVSGAEFADSIGADLINSSLGYIGFDDEPMSHTYADLNGNTAFITRGADKASEKGILVVNSAGNDGSNPFKYIGAPADGDSVLTVGSVTSSGNRSGFSSVGPTYDRRIKPTVVAQGSSSALYTTYGFSYGVGTSFASPIICGMTACLWQSRPGFTNMQIIEAIKTSASQFSRPDSLLGYGIPNYGAAFTILSVKKPVVDKNIVVYPNPVTDRVTISLPSAVQGKYTIEIVNLQGMKVYSFSANDNSMRSVQVNNLGNLASGVYLIKLLTNSMLYTGKFIK